MKQSIKTFLFRTRILSFLIASRARAYVIMFHGVGDHEMPSTAFEELLRIIARESTIVPLQSLPDAIGEDAAPGGRKKPFVSLTFDDGLKNNADVAYPILQKLGSPATFFICPALVGSGSWIWTHEVRARWDSLAQPVRRELAQTCFGLELELEEFVRALKGLPQARRSEVQEILREKSSHFRPTDSQRLRYDLMDWETIEALDPALIDIGSHTNSHPMLDSATEVELDYEIAESRRLIEQRLDREVPCFCYPDGRTSPGAIDLVERNYSIAVTTRANTVTESDSRASLPRVGSISQPSEFFWRVFRGSR